MSALADAAGAMSALDGAGEFDIRAAVADAAGMAVNAARRGLKLSDVVRERDIDVSPEAFVVAQFLADNIRSGKRIADGLRAWAQLAQQQLAIVRDNAAQGDAEPRHAFSEYPLGQLPLAWLHSCQLRPRGVWPMPGLKVLVGSSDW